MKKLTLALLFLLILNGLLFAETKKITIVNNTEYPISALFASPSSSDDWGDNLLPEGTVIAWGDEYVLELDVTGECVYDIKLTDTDADSYRKWEVNVCDLEQVEFTFSDFVSDEETGGDMEDGNGGDLDAAYQEGYREGYKDGFKDAYSDGYREGYEKAMEEMKRKLENQQ